MNTSYLWGLLVDILFAKDARYGDSGAPLITEEDDWNELVSLANANLVSAALWTKLQERNIHHVVPGAVQEYLDAFSEINRTRSDALIEQTLECIDALLGEDIPAMPIKGAAYLLNDPGDSIRDRFSTDIDIMVPGDRVAAATRILSGLGYEPAPHESVDYDLHHHAPPMWRKGNPTTIELHRSAVPHFIEQALPTAELWKSSIECARDGLPFSIPCATDAMTIVFVHSAVIDRSLALLQLPLRTYMDVAYLADVDRENLDWSAIEARAATIGERSLLNRFLYAACRLTEDNDVSRRAALAGWASFHACKLALEVPALVSVAIRLDRLSSHSLRSRTVGPGDTRSATLYRLREIYSMLLRGAGRFT